jgi:hypothetical protein
LQQKIKKPLEERLFLAVHGCTAAGVSRREQRKNQQNHDFAPAFYTAIFAE